ncbi:uncharacterized protein EDB91DRAFT_1254013 [Suillus paluster]|uniref:uncharacterized protein n=1 Tax=Suillus paluster TaxID=48578 RepID=UPI001B86EBC1|nr:uncharacterized protein EDB91DRAFT_1254013 [Suillus paluster]KAG1727188.1 hypothetical protein EDB91DRAFT_1254013 [Suillus paluster]
MSDSQNATSNTQSSLMGLGRSGTSSQANAGRSVVSQQELVEKCLSTVDDYKQGIITKQEAIVTIAKTVVSATNKASDQAESFIATPYFDMLDEWSRELERSRASQRMDFNGSKALSRMNLLESDASWISPVLDEPNNPLEEVSSPQTSHVLTKSSLTGLKTPKKWAEIVASKCVNLDAIHSIISSSHTIDKCTEMIKDIEIKFSGTSEAVSKKITTAVQWSAAWNRTARAIKFAFPYREDELTAYGEYINDKFDRRLERTHERIICFDKAIRNRAANLCRVELSDFAAFTNIYKSHFQSNGRHCDEDKQSASGAPAWAKSVFMLKPVGMRMFARTHKTEDSMQGVTQKQGLIWSPTDATFSPTTHSSEYAEPVPLPPLNEISDSDAARTIAQRPDLFRIVTPINVDRFKELLLDHPNQPFVKSVCQALHQGFWPWADTSDDSYPSINDNSSHTCAKSNDQLRFIEDQICEEIRLGRLSESFGTELYPGMYSVPMHTVPKPNSDKLCLVVDHTVGNYSLNSMIERDAIKGTKLDGLHSLGVLLLRFCKQHPNIELVMFKSDVSQAFRRLPMHPLWQVKQILTIHGQRHVDRNNNFDGRGSPKVWISFMSLVAWIAIHCAFIDTLKTYMDNSFSFEISDRVLYYVPYDCCFPAKQTHLLQLWDELNLLHERPKQLFGTSLTVIGFNVDPNTMRVSLLDHKKAELVVELHHFAHKNHHWTLHKFQHLAGWCEWSFNVFPLLKPGLSVLYNKIQGKTNTFAQIHTNNALLRKLHWLADHIERSDGLHFFKCLDFDPLRDDVVVVYTDMSAAGLGLWFPDDNFAC